MAKRMSVRYTFGILIIFELWHCFSHARHVPGKMQAIVIHAVAYLFQAGLLWVFYDISERFPSLPMIGVMVVVTSWDLYAFVKLPFIHYFFASLLLLMLILVSYVDLIPSRSLSILAVLLAALILVVFNETRHCQRMLQHKVFPYHIMIEILGVIIFLVLGNILLELKKSHKRRRKSKTHLRTKM
jgi:hypothetical protein